MAPQSTWTNCQKTHLRRQSFCYLSLECDNAPLFHQNWKTDQEHEDSTTRHRHTPFQHTRHIACNPQGNSCSLSLETSHQSVDAATAQNLHVGSSHETMAFCVVLRLLFEPDTLLEPFLPCHLPVLPCTNSDPTTTIHVKCHAHSRKHNAGKSREF